MEILKRGGGAIKGFPGRLQWGGPASVASVLWWEGAGGMYMFITLLSYTIGCLFVSDVEDILGAGCRNTVWQRYLIYDLNVRHVEAEIRDVVYNCNFFFNSWCCVVCKKWMWMTGRGTRFTGITRGTPNRSCGSGRWVLTSTDLYMYLF